MVKEVGGRICVPLEWIKIGKKFQKFNLITDISCKSYLDNIKFMMVPFIMLPFSIPPVVTPNTFQETYGFKWGNGINV